MWLAEWQLSKTQPQYLDGVVERIEVAVHLAELNTEEKV